MEKLLNEQVIGQIQQAFADLSNPVQMLFFGSAENCDYCNEIKQLLTELSGIDSRVSLSIHDLKEDAVLAAQYRVDKSPVTVIASKDGDTVMDMGIQFAGIPAGHEFSTLINDIIFASKRQSTLSAATLEFLQTLTEPLLLQVFVTPTCPHCPRAALLAHQMAMVNPAMVRAEAVDAMEFPELSERFSVQGVPQTVINSGRGIVVGAYPELQMLAEIKRAMQN